MFTQHNLFTLFISRAGERGDGDGDGGGGREDLGDIAWLSVQRRDGKMAEILY